MHEFFGTVVDFSSFQATCIMCRLSWTTVENIGNEEHVACCQTIHHQFTWQEKSFSVLFSVENVPFLFFLDFYDHFFIKVKRDRVGGKSLRVWQSNSTRGCQKYIPTKPKRARHQNLSICFLRLLQLRNQTSDDFLEKNGSFHTFTIPVWAIYFILEWSVVVKWRQLLPHSNLYPWTGTRHLWSVRAFGCWIPNPSATYKCLILMSCLVFPISFHPPIHMSLKTVDIAYLIYLLWIV